MSLRRENLEELCIILFEMFAVHLKIVCIFLYLSLLEEIKIPILSYPILSIKQLVNHKLINACCSS